MARESPGIVGSSQLSVNHTIGKKRALTRDCACLHALTFDISIGY